MLPKVEVIADYRAAMTTVAQHLATFPERYYAAWNGRDVSVLEPPTSKPFDITGTDVWTVDGEGRATSIRAYYDTATLVRQLGLG